MEIRTGLRTTQILCALGVAVLGTGASVQASFVPLQNGGFTSPDASTSPATFYTVAGIPTGWVGPPGSDTAIGVFYNTPIDPLNPPNPNPLFITNMVSTQSAYMFNAPGLFISQNVAGSNYEVGKSYKLKFGVLASDATVPFVGAVPDGDPIAGLLYYGGNPSNVVGTLSVPAGVQQKNQTLLFDTELDVPAVLPSDAWANQQIGVMFFIPLTASGGGVWDVTDVTLEAVPEPAALSILGLGAAAVLWRRRRPA
jgi:hypothetical protein